MNQKVLKSEDFNVPSLGKCNINSPLKLSKKKGDDVFDYIKPNSRVVFESDLEKLQKTIKDPAKILSFEKAGPYEKIYFEPAKTKVGIVNCGGLCPGLNNVIRALYMTLRYRYNVQSVIGFKYGYEGFIPAYEHPVVELNHDKVDDIHTIGGSILGSSRGGQDVSCIVDTLEKMNINILYTIGGDGTLKGAQAITEEITKRNLKIAVGGIPKTIDNDISFIDRSFGFETAFTKATHILRDAHNEAKGAYNGIAIVKLMGRDSGFIAANAALSMPDVNFVLIPEVNFDLYGEKGFLEILKRRLEKKKHALIAVAEGAGQHLFDEKEKERDPSGNLKLKDIGVFLKQKIKEYFEEKEFPFVLKYIDPSYIIRSAPAIANDSKFCIQLAQNAVHATMAGKTGFVVGNWNNSFTLLPIPLTVKGRKRINLEGELWYNVLESTGQPYSMKNKRYDKD
jgi:6-phosphofructokinase 1